MTIKHCTIKKDDSKVIAINLRGDEEVSFGYNDGGD